MLYFCCATKVELVSHNDKYWYSHRKCLNRDHEKYILGQFIQLEEDGYKCVENFTGTRYSRNSWNKP